MLLKMPIPFEDSDTLHSVSSWLACIISNLLIIQVFYLYMNYDIYFNLNHQYFHFIFIKKETKQTDSLGIADQEIQTEVHPIATYIDSNYTWNEWELRRRALQLVCHLFSSYAIFLLTMYNNFITISPDISEIINIKRF